MRPGDRLICAFVEPQETGSQFKEWPLHATVMPWFRTPLKSQALVERLEEALTDEQPFPAGVGAQKSFAVVKVNLLPPGQWQSLHDKVLGVINENARNTAPLRFVGKNYKPHVTIQKSARLHEGDSFRVDRLHLVVQQGKYKEVESEIRLGRTSA